MGTFTHQLRYVLLRSGQGGEGACTSVCVCAYVSVGGDACEIDGGGFHRPVSVTQQVLDRYTYLPLEPSN